MTYQDVKEKPDDGCYIYGSFYFKQNIYTFIKECI